jgi:hypothetical protein
MISIEARHLYFGDATHLALQQQLKRAKSTSAAKSITLIANIPLYTVTKSFKYLP